MHAMKNRRRSVLIAESNRTLAQSLRLQLEEMGLQVFVAHDGEQAAILAARQRFQLIIASLELSGRGGSELCRHVREDLRLTEVPIVVTAAAESESDARSLVYRHGVCRVITPATNTEAIVDAAQESIEYLVAAM
ncbi:response regulator [Schlesneria paludicola]|uniref:response regulator n=1 Tax=Schlesneria paludicola TaxID=360056 RepID=UPI00029A5A08|nr:response regulator [Schlesneria paludicola]